MPDFYFAVNVVKCSIKYITFFGRNKCDGSSAAAEINDFRH